MSAIYVAAKTSTWAGSDIICLGRLMVRDTSTQNAVAAVQSQVSSIVWNVYASGTSVASGTAAPASAIFNTLQTGSIWTQDATGFNFLYQLAGSNFPNDNTNYFVVFVFTMSDGSILKASFENSTLDPTQGGP